LADDRIQGQTSTDTLHAAWMSDVGRVRETNQDTYVAAPEMGLFAISDGMGGEVAGDYAAQLVADSLPDLLADCLVAVASWNDVCLNETIAAACPRLRLWEHVAGSVKHMFGPWLEDRDITIASCAPSNGENVAEYALGLLIVGLKRALENAAANRTGGNPKPPNARVLASSTIGVVGASQVGRHLVRFLKPFGPTVLVYDPHLSDAEAAALGARKTDDLTALCAESHAVTLHAPSLPETAGMIGVQQLRAMRDDAVLVNTARGALVDEAALIAELSKGRLFAMLDVTEPEPAANDSPLRRLPNVMLTSHIAGMPDWKMGRQAVDDVERFLRGEKPLMAVTADMLGRLG